MNIDAEREVMPGAHVNLDVVEHKGRLVFETQFIFYDFELRNHDIRAHGIGEFDYEGKEAFLFGHEAPPDFRSARIFHLAQGETVKMECGDRITAVMQSSYISREKTKDGRRKLHITVCNARRIYHWTRFYLPQKGIALMLWCGSRRAREKEILLTVRKGIHVKDGRAHPVIAEVLPDGSVLRVSRDYQRSIMTTGDYRLRERQKGRTMQNIDKDFLRVPLYDRMIPTRERNYMRRYAIHA